jgi:hypothetical protein
LPRDFHERRVDCRIRI